MKELSKSEIGVIISKPANIGEGHYRAKLTEYDVIIIRLHRENYGVSYNELAKIHNVNPSTIERICKRMIWKHVL